MTTVPIPLDRIFLDDLAICPRSLMLRVEPGDRPELRASPWWVHVVCFDHDPEPEVDFAW